LCILKEPMVVPEHRFILHALISEKALDVRLVARSHAPGLLDQGREADRLLTINQVRKPDHHCPRRRQLHLSLPPRKAILASSRRMSSSPSLQHRGGIPSHCPQIEISRPPVLPHTHGAASTVSSSERVSPQSAHWHGRAKRPTIPFVQCPAGDAPAFPWGGTLEDHPSREQGGWHRFG